MYKKALEVQILNEVALSQLLVKILERSDKEKTTFKAIEKYRHGLWKTVSKHLNHFPKSYYCISNSRVCSFAVCGKQ